MEGIPRRAGSPLAWATSDVVSTVLENSTCSFRLRQWSRRRDSSSTVLRQTVGQRTEERLVLELCYRRQMIRKGSWIAMVRTVLILKLLLLSTTGIIAGEPQGIIAFSSLGPRHWDLYATTSDGGARQLTMTPELEYNAAFSPDGKRIAFASERDGNVELYVMDYDGTQTRRLTDVQAMDDHPTWSPDGQQIAFASTRDAPTTLGQGWNGIYVMKADGSNVWRLSPQDTSDYSPAWSPRTDLIAFSSGNGGRDLYMMKADGTQRRLVVRHGGWPAFIDGGRALAFHRRGEENRWDIWRVNLDGSEPSVLVENACMPRASADGQKLAVVLRTDRLQQVAVVDVSDGAVQVITDEQSDHWNPTISPDGETVVYHRESRGLATPGVEQWDAPKGMQLRLLRLDGAFPAFSPDRRRIAFIDADIDVSIGFSRVEVMNVDGSERSTLFLGTRRSLFGMSWSAEPERIAFSHGRVFADAKFAVDIKTVSPDGGDAFALTGDDGNNGFPSYSPDGTQMVFRSGRDGAKNLYIMDRNGNNVRRLTEGNWTDSMCDWSPRGNWITFASDRDDNFEIWKVRPDGTDLQKVLGGGGRNNHPHFSPDGEWIVFTSQRAGLSAESVSTPQQPQPYGDIFIMRADGSDVTRLTHNSFEEGTPAWAE